jgi:prepilin-type processing-associated H-X9-DG protein
MSLYAFSGLTEVNPPHGIAYNILYGDGHVTGTPRREYLSLPKSAAHWNRDNQPHPETWGPVSDWVVGQ